MRTIAASISVLLGLVACSVAVAAPSAPSRGEFIRKGDALCTQVKRELAPLLARAEAAKSLSRERQWVAVVDLWTDQIRIQKRFIGRFHAIGVPVNDRRARRLSSGLDRGLVLARRVRAAFADRDEARVPGALSAYLGFTVDLNARTRAYGFRVCGH